MTGITCRAVLRGLLFLQPGELGFQVAYSPAKTAQLGRHALVWPGDVAEERLRHDVSSSYLGVTDSMASRAVANRVHCLWRRDGEVHIVFIAAAPGFHGGGRP